MRKAIKKNLQSEVEQKYQELKRSFPTKEPMLPKGAKPVPPLREQIKKRLVTQRWV